MTTPNDKTITLTSEQFDTLMRALCHASARASQMADYWRAEGKTASSEAWGKAEQDIDTLYAALKHITNEADLELAQE